ncbi:MAG: hypothetical protein PVS2B2_16450 [Candidatus Acidiferrum sp.]
MPAKAGGGSLETGGFRAGRNTVCQRRRKKPIRTGLGVNYNVAEVIIQESESLENALRRFKRKVQQEDIIKEIKKHSFYMKPGEKRRTKEALSRKRLRKKMRRETE